MYIFLCLSLRQNLFFYFIFTSKFCYHLFLLCTLSFKYFSLYSKINFSYILVDIKNLFSLLFSFAYQYHFYFSLIGSSNYIWSFFFSKLFFFYLINIFALMVYLFKNSSFFYTHFYLTFCLSADFFSLVLTFFHFLSYVFSILSLSTLSNAALRSINNAFLLFFLSLFLAFHHYFLIYLHLFFNCSTVLLLFFLLLLLFSFHTFY